MSEPVQNIDEPVRQTPVVERPDVLVAGGGPAGVAAAVAAGRAGARVRLIETHGCLGGVWTAGLLSWILDKDNKPGLMREILAGLDASNARRGNAYDAEVMKRLLETRVLEAGVGVRLHSRVVAAARDECNRLAVAITESKSGREAWAAKCFIDCTGDGDLAAHAGCGFEVGRPSGGPGSEGGEPGETQPMSLMALITGVSHTDLHAHGLQRGERVTGRQAKNAMRAECERAGVTPSYGDPTIFCIRENLHAMMANHEYGYSALNAQDLTDATVHARAEVHRLIEALRATGGIWSGLRIVASAEQIGVREARRIRGHYTVTADDLTSAARFPDAVCRVTFGVDVHSTTRSRGDAVEAKSIDARQYDIPYRALVAADVHGLLLAGRCISGDFLAHSSYRVTGNAVAMGQAAGAAAALCAATDRLPHELPWEDVQETLARLERDDVSTP